MVFIFLWLKMAKLQNIYFRKTTLFIQEWHWTDNVSPHFCSNFLPLDEYECSKTCQGKSVWVTLHPLTLLLWNFFCSYRPKWKAGSDDPSKWFHLRLLVMKFGCLHLPSNKRIIKGFLMASHISESQIFQNDRHTRSCCTWLLLVWHVSASFFIVLLFRPFQYGKEEKDDSPFSYSGLLGKRKNANSLATCSH